MAPHVFKVKLASKAQVEKVSEIMEKSHFSKSLIENLHQAGFPEAGFPWGWDNKRNTEDNRVQAFDKMESKLLKQLTKDGFTYSHVDAEGFDVYVQAEKTKQATLEL